MHYKQIFNVVGVAAVSALFCVGCSEKPDDNGGGDVTETETTITDSRGGKSTTYRKVKIGTQTWMGENLNYAADGSKCYGEGGQVAIGWDDENDIPITKTLTDSEIQANCEQYGRLYNWATAKTACPSGWHLPSDAEWTTLVNYAGGEDIAGTKLKSTSGWNREGVPAGTDEFKFSALPGGYRNPNSGNFEGLGHNSGWWSATESNVDEAWFRYISDYGEGIDRPDDNKALLFSVRCVQD